MKKIYRKPKTQVFKFGNDFILASQSLSYGGPGGGNIAESKRNTLLIDYDDDLFDDKSVSSSEAEIYCHVDL